MTACIKNKESAHREVNTVLDEMNDVIDEFLGELPVDFLDNDTLNNLYRGMKETVSSAKKSLEKYRIDNGIPIQRIQMESLEANNFIIKDNLQPQLREFAQEADKIARSINSPEVSKAFQNGVYMSLYESLPPDARVMFNESKSISAAMEGLTHAQRVEVLNNVTDRFPTHFQDVREAVAAHNINPKRRDKLTDQLDRLEAKVNGALDIATIYARNPYYFKVDSEGNQLPYIDASPG